MVVWVIKDKGNQFLCGEELIRSHIRSLCWRKTGKERGRTGLGFIWGSFCIHIHLNILHNVVSSSDPRVFPKALVPMPNTFHKAAMISHCGCFLNDIVEIFLLEMT